MKKNRNAFFNDSNYPQMNPMNTNQYPGSNMPYGMPMPGAFNNPYSEIEERLAKLERQVSRLDHRMNQIEASGTKSTDDFESTTNNMYIL